MQGPGEYHREREDEGAEMNNYRLFLQTYMTYNSETGHLERKTNYWDKNGDDYTPETKENLDLINANY